MMVTLTASSARRGASRGGARRALALPRSSCPPSSGCQQSPAVCSGPAPPICNRDALLVVVLDRNAESRRYDHMGAYSKCRAFEIRHRKIIASLIALVTFGIVAHIDPTAVEWYLMTLIVTVVWYPSAERSETERRNRAQGERSWDADEDSNLRRPSYGQCVLPSCRLAVRFVGACCSGDCHGHRWRHGPRIVPLPDRGLASAARPARSAPTSPQGRLESTTPHGATGASTR